MAEFAPVAPPSILRTLKKEGLLGNYHLLLAHDVAEHPQEYADIFNDTGAYIIMDNSVIELGEPIEVDTMRLAVHAVPSNLVVLPDYLLDAKATIGVSTEAARTWMEADLAPFMAVPQGETKEEILVCADVLMKLPGVLAWGVARNFTDDEVLRSRREITKILHSMDSSFEVHLLGFSDDLFDDIVLTSRIPYVRGIDSAVPIRMGLQGMSLSLEQTEHPPRGDYWDSDGEITPEVRANLEIIREWLK